MSPSEVREAIARGLTIYGSSSMGALRASEIPEVHGVGRVCAMFKSGEIENDDEVALSFDPETFRTYSEPLVNIRYATERLAHAGTIDRALAKRIVSIAKKLFYPERSYARILAESGLAERADAPQLLAMLRSYDLKREDATTLLEQLARLDTRLISSAGRSARVAGEARVAPPTTAELSPTAPLLFWEYGESIPFEELVRFLKLTADLAPHAHAALARYALEGNELVVKAPLPKKAVEKLGRLLLEAQLDQWELPTLEARLVTLRDVGLPHEELGERIAEEAEARARVMAIAREGSPDFLRALRTELFMNELALKRHAIRFGSLLYFAAQYRSARPPSAEIVRGVEAHLCERFDAASWRVALETLALWGVTAVQANAFVQTMARARVAVAQVPVVKKQRLATAVGREKPLRLVSTPKLRGDRRFCVPWSRALRSAKRLTRVVKITRVSIITGLDNIGLCVSQVFRPDGYWSSTVGSGKSLTLAGAKIGGIMEEVEKWAQERFSLEKDVATVRGSYTALAKKHEIVDPAELDLPYDTRYAPDRPIEWSWLTDLVEGRRVLVPFAAITQRRLPDDPYYSERRGEKVFSTNGLASGFTLAEAVSHGVAELIERHSSVLASIAMENPGLPWPHDYRVVDPSTLPASSRRIHDRITRAGHRPHIVDITCELGVPAFLVLLEVEKDDDRFSAGPLGTPGMAAHPDAEVALNGALLEAVQSRLGNIAGAREDLSINIRSLGRHERTRCHTRAAHRFLHGTMGRTRSFDEVATFESRDVKLDVEWMVERLRRSGIRRLLVADLSRPEIAAARVVRVLATGIETMNPFRTGPWARKMMTADLLATRR